jgi:hypothetical protein
VIISVHHTESLPAELESWIDLWLGQKGHRPEVLLALFDPVYSGISASLRTYLEGVAKKGRMQFLVQSEERPEDR